MRRSMLVFLLALLAVLVFLVHSVFTLLQLLVETGDADAIRNWELPDVGSNKTLPGPELIPRILHQTYKNESIPEKWKEPWESCQKMHWDYEYKFWTDEKAREFIAAEYAWFLATYDDYRYPIQRADTIRYFVLAHYGGTYLDLDDGCARRLDPLNTFPAWLHRTLPTGISNDAMGAAPRHPFLLYVIERLQAYDRDWKLGYITVMYTTGPLFLSVLWKEWMKGGRNVGDGPGGGRVRVMQQNHYQRVAESFFLEFLGSSWHGDDARFIFWMGDNWLLLTLAGLAAAAAVAVLLWWLYQRALALAQSRDWAKRGWRAALGRVGRKEYELVDRRVD